MTELVVGGADPAVACRTPTPTSRRRRAASRRAATSAPAIGYTPGADAQALTINRSHDQAIVRLDQKIDPDETFLEGIHLVGPNGGNITSPTQATVPTQGPGPQPLTLDFGASEIPEGTVGIRFDVDTRACEALFTFDLEPGDSSSLRGGERRPGVRRRGACPSVGGSTEKCSSRAGGHSAARFTFEARRGYAYLILC